MAGFTSNDDGVPYCKPHPIGVLPKYLHNERRAEALARAIGDYIEDGLWPHSAWAEELAGLLRGIEKDYAERSRMK
jgi:hypothetical protein